MGWRNSTRGSRKPRSAANMRTPIRIDSQVRTPDSRGGFALAWTELYSGYAERIDLSGSEQTRAAQTTSTQMKRFKLRWPPSVDINAAKRLVDLTTGRAYNIRDVSGPDQNGSYTTLLCEYVPGSGGA